jgi:YbbR domain-containing protein
VTVKLDTVPDGVSVGPEQVDPESVTVRGASSRVQSVAQVVARVPIDASALNVDRSFDLVAVDANGNTVPNVELDPERVRVRIAVARQLATRSLPVVPNLSGAPATGYRITSVRVEPLIVTVSGEEAVVSHLDNAPTEPIDINGRTSDLEAEVSLDLPDGVSVTGSDSVRVMLSIAEETGSATYQVAIELGATNAGLDYALADHQATVILSGPTTLLQNLDAALLRATANVGGLSVGSHAVSLALEPPDGLTLVAITPQQVSVVVSVPPTPTPSITP